MHEENLPRLKTRDPWLDNIRGFLMMLVVMGHLLYPLVWNSRMVGWIYDYINFFHMCAFMVLSGFLSKRRIADQDWPGVINKLLLPYLLCQLMYYVFAAFIPGGMKQIHSSLNHLSFTTPIYHLWYIFALVIYNGVCIPLQPQRHPVLSMVIAVALSLGVGLFPSVRFLQLSRMAGMFPAFLLGLLLPKAFVNEKVRKRTFWATTAGIAVFLVGFALFYIPSYRHRWLREDVFSMCVSYRDLNPQSPVAYGLGIRAAMLLAGPVMLFAMGAVLPRCRCFLTKLGERGVYIYIVHAFVVVAARPSGLAYRAGHSSGDKIVTVLFALVLPFLLVSDPVYRVFHRIVEPKADFRNLFRQKSREKV